MEDLNIIPRFKFDPSSDNKPNFENIQLHGAPCMSKCNLKVMSSADIRRLSVKRITEVTLYDKTNPKHGGCQDIHMGSISRHEKCSTCLNSMDKCPGHFGHIELPLPVFHPLYLSAVMFILKNVCISCYQLRVKLSPLELETKIFSNPKRCIMRKSCEHCGIIQPNYRRISNFSLSWSWPPVPNCILNAKSGASTPTKKKSVSRKKKLIPNCAISIDGWSESWEEGEHSLISPKGKRKLSVATKITSGKKVKLNTGIAHDNVQSVVDDESNNDELSKNLTKSGKPRKQTKTTKKAIAKQENQTPPLIKQEVNDTECVLFSQPLLVKEGKAKKKTVKAKTKKVSTTICDSEQEQNCLLDDESKILLKNDDEDDEDEEARVLAEEAALQQQQKVPLKYPFEYAKLPLTSVIVYNILDKLDVQILPYLKINVKHPRDLMVTDVLVLPRIARSSSHTGATDSRPKCENTITYKYVNILKTIEVINKRDKRKRTIYEILDRLQNNVMSYLVNDTGSSTGIQVSLPPPPTITPPAQQPTPEEHEKNGVQVNSELTIERAETTATTPTPIVVPLAQMPIAGPMTSRTVQVRGSTMQAMFGHGRGRKSLTNRMRGKEGRVRGNLIGKRTNASGRAVIVPNPNIRMDEISIPRKIAKLILVQERVCNSNIEKMQRLMYEKKIRFIVELPRDNPNYDGHRMLVKLGITDENYKSVIEDGTLRVGVVVEREVIDGDYVLFNRQPSLHRMSIMCHRAVVYDDSNHFGLHPGVAAPYNADFDGDEMNLHILSSLTSISEASELMLVPKCIISPQNSRTIMGLIQDSTLALGILSDETTYVPREMVHDLIMKMEKEGLLCQDNNDNSENKKNVDDMVAYLPRDGMQRVSFSKFTGNNDTATPIPQTNKRKRTTTDNEDNEEGEEGDVGELCYSGRQAIQSILPTDFYYVHATNNVKIVNGLIVSGRLTKHHLGCQPGCIIERLFHLYGETVAGNFITNAQLLASLYLQRNVFSIGWKDCEPTNESRKNIRNIIDDHIGGLIKPHWSEGQIMQSLNELRKKVGAAIPIDKSNRLLEMVTTGSKGSVVHASQIMALVGQQAACGARMKKAHGSNTQRTLPYFSNEDRSVEMFGFVKESYVDGLSPDGAIFHAISGREGLYNTSVNTATTGYFNRRCANAMNDLSVAYDGTVRNAEGGVVQIRYGQDGFDAIQMCNVKMNHFLPASTCYHPNNFAESIKNTLKCWAITRIKVNDITDINGCDSFADVSDIIRKYVKDTNHSLTKEEDERLGFAEKGGYSKGTRDAFQSIFFLSSVLRILNCNDDHNRHETKNFENCESDDAQKGFEAFKMLSCQVFNMDESHFGQASYFGNSQTSMIALIKEILTTNNKNNDSLIIENKKKLVISYCMWWLLKAWSAITSDMIAFYVVTQLLCDAPFAIWKRGLMVRIFERWARAQANPGEMVGEIAAQSVCALATQSSLDTFHTTGVESCMVTLGTPRMRELVDVISKLKLPMCSVQLKEKVDPFEMCRSLLFVRFADLLEDTQSLNSMEISEKYPWAKDVFYDDDHENQQPNYNNELYGFVYTIKKNNRSRYWNPQTIIAKLIQQRKQSDKSSKNKFLNVYAVGSNKLLYLVRSMATPEQHQDQVDEHRQRQQMDHGLRQHVLSDGVKGIEGVEIALFCKPHTILHIKGDNILITLSKIKGFVPESLVSNSIIETERLFGINATSQYIANEMGMIYRDEAMSHRHTMLITNTLCHFGTLIPFTRHGVNRTKATPLSKCAFEETMDVLVNSTIHGEESDMRNLTESIMCGGIVPSGTGLVNLRIPLSENTIPSPVFREHTSTNLYKSLFGSSTSKNNHNNSLANPMEAKRYQFVQMMMDHDKNAQVFQAIPSYYSLLLQQIQIASSTKRTHPKN